MSNYQKFSYLFDRELVRRRALLTISALNKSLPDVKNEKSLVTPVELCLVLYNIMIDGRLFQNERPETKEEFNMRISKWLEEKHTLYWLLTCEAVDELLKNNSIIWNKNGSLELRSKKRSYDEKK
jgi:hypothetical protein